MMYVFSFLICLIWTIVSGLFSILVTTVIFIWTLRCDKDPLFLMESLRVWGNDGEIESLITMRYAKQSYWYKTYFHWIWGIKTEF